MALLTDMTLGEARALGARYGLEVAHVASIQAGSVNSNFVFTLASGERRFVRVCEESGMAAVAEQNRLLAHLVARGVPTPAPLAMQGGGTVAAHRDKPAVAFAFVSGEAICQRGVTEPHARAVGAALAKIHRAGSDYAGAPESRFRTEQLRWRLEGLTAGHYGKLGREHLEAVRLLSLRLDELTPAAASERSAGHGARSSSEGASSCRTEELAVAECGVAPAAEMVIHGDVFRDNVLWRAGSLAAILDFESASAGSPPFDLMVTMLAWCFGDTLDHALGGALAAGYLEVRPLDQGALDGCYDAARLAAVRFATTRLTDYELRPRGVVVYKDFRRFLGRLAAIEALGREAFRDLVAGS